MAESGTAAFEATAVKSGPVVGVNVNYRHLGPNLVGGAYGGFHHRAVYVTHDKLPPVAGSTMPAAYPSVIEIRRG